MIQLHTIKYNTESTCCQVYNRQLKYTHPLVLRCTRCNKIRKDVKIVDYNYLMLSSFTEK